ncbi:hypothetical protein BOTNAR_0197g00120 [Botryotinia narcissicola]|uniref:Uncharacterized protein n=1 Tax=Botryotinia narcissicola TaxID=278944 RepID=A0A4Z1IDH5_9HELO|nr:hypothetical protein BOTNAR_0197g00120 [Botryotinia narcissicola]
MSHGCAWPTIPHALFDEDVSSCGFGFCEISKFWRDKPDIVELRLLNKRLSGALGFPLYFEQYSSEES